MVDAIKYFQKSDPALLKQIEEYKKRRNLNNKQEARWFAMFYELLAFKIKHGHLNVSAKYEQLPALGYWVSVQRNKPLTEQRKLLLEN